ncbi:LAMI_0G16996g1_1 [Lachancea mirantina]|uniref:LAMI_0G16996g1_1 n=1 Tax=Lachancea mirantina TaxID=1230905 RepID=A0A1G4KD38_9SACH|nr:LAMI_0G16996g1_1 [Lachancea mirantina]
MSRAKKAPTGLPVSDPAYIAPQQIVDLFKLAFDNELYRDPDELSSMIQEVKKSLYDRQYLDAFDNNEKRSAYCCRWSPSRAVAYAALFNYLRPVRATLLRPLTNSSPVTAEELHVAHSDTSEFSPEIMCIGGGAGGELVALAALFAPSLDFRSKYSTIKSTKSSKAANVRIIDIADWDNVVTRLAGAIRERWLYDLSDQFAITFQRADILRQDATQMSYSKLDLITLLFTTNELFQEDKGASIRFLQTLNQHCKTGCLLLIVESAGSYSHIEIGTKKFPIHFLVDTILTGKRGDAKSGMWELVDQNDSFWYRNDDRIDYPLKLENMRFFYRLYRKR